MTTKVTIEPSGHHVLVLVTDKWSETTTQERATLLQPAGHYVENEWVATGQGPWVGHATTTRTISVVDLDPLDPRVIKANGEHNAPVA